MKKSEIKEYSSKDEEIFNTIQMKQSVRKEAMQLRWQESKYHIHEVKQNKEAKQERQQDPQYHADEAKWNKEAMKQRRQHTK